MTLFFFPEFDYLAQKLQYLPMFEHGWFSADRFANEELVVRLHTEVKNKKCIILGSVNPPDEHLTSFLLLAHTLKKEGAKTVTGLLPYLAYSRQDKEKPKESLAAAWLGQLFSASGVDKVITVDAHSPRLAKLFPIPVTSLSPVSIFKQIITEHSLADATIIAPDEGAKERAETLRKTLNTSQPIAWMKKERTPAGIVQVALHGKVGERTVIVDDILDTGATLIGCSERLRRKGVREIYITVTHGLFTGETWHELWSTGVKHIYCTDTIPFVRHLPDHHITWLPIAPIIEQYLLTLNHDESLK